MQCDMYYVCNVERKMCSMVQHVRHVVQRGKGGVATPDFRSDLNKKGFELDQSLHYNFRVSLVSLKHN